MSEDLIEEVLVHHRSLLKFLSNENERYTNHFKSIEIETKLARIQNYIAKLRSLREEMSSLSKQSDQLRKRAEILCLTKRRNDENYVHELERIKQMEQSLKPIECKKFT
ncbi:hypothetical protein SSS_10412 [Sarcoptes scabiei]|nr:hypothetical protein SSS_10412 [Sarcoptes scabiei]UXI20576.1 hypothetical protein NH340_JMT06519 [Sarcoptes scabiei]